MHTNDLNSNPTTQCKCWAIVPAAGVGSRMGSDIPKQYLSLNGKPVIEYSLRLLLATDWITHIVVAISEDDDYWKSLAISSEPGIVTVIGGKERTDSVANALSYIKQHSTEQEYVLVHDAARPCLTKDDLALIRGEMTRAKNGLLLADKLADTIKLADDSLHISKTVPRDGLWRALTPQVFPLSLLVRALNKANNQSEQLVGKHITDEASAIEVLGLSPLLIQGRSDNIKITKADDLHLASFILKAHQTKGKL